MISKAQRALLVVLRDGGADKLALAVGSGVALGSVDRTLKALARQGFCTDDCAHDITDLGRRALARDPRLTKAMVALLSRVGSRRDVHIQGPEVRVARRLEEFGFVIVTDDGELRPGGISDGERWSAAITKTGQEAYDAVRSTL